MLSSQRLRFRVKRFDGVQYRFKRIHDMSKEIKDPETNNAKMVRAIAKGDNIAAYKLLEKITKQKIAEKINKAMKDA